MTTIKSISKSGVSFEDALEISNLADARKALEEVQSLGEGYFNNEFSYRYSVNNLKEAIDIFDRANKNPKPYDIYYIIKANRRKSVHCMSVVAGTAKDAKTIVRYAVLKTTGRNAFNMTSDKLPTGYVWSHFTERYGVTEDEIKEQARKDCFYL